MFRQDSKSQKYSKTATGATLADEAGSAPGIHDASFYESMMPKGLFNEPSARVDYQFMCRYITAILEMVNVREDAKEASANDPFESMFYIRGFDKQTSASQPQWLLDTHFIVRMTQRCCCSLTTMVGGLDYFLRIKEKKGLQLSTCTWKSLFVTCLLLSEKMWEDNFVHPQHIIQQFAGYCPGSTTHSKREFQHLQMSMIGALDWQMNMPEPRYRQLLQAVFAQRVPRCVMQHMDQHANNVFVSRPLPQPPKMNFRRDPNYPPVVKDTTAAADKGSVASNRSAWSQSHSRKNYARERYSS